MLKPETARHLAFQKEGCPIILLTTGVLQRGSVFILKETCVRCIRQKLLFSDFSAASLLLANKARPAVIDVATQEPEYNPGERMEQKATYIDIWDIIPLGQR